MICEKCGKHEATVHITRNINGDITEMNLCSECAEASGNMPHIRVDDFFSDFFSSVMPARARRMAFRPAGIINVYAGCEDCLEGVSPETGKSEKDEKAEKLGELKNSLRLAVASEDFEKAIQLRDEIRALEKKEESGA